MSPGPREVSEVQVYQAPERSQQASHLGPGRTCPVQGAVSAKALSPLSPRPLRWSLGASGKGRCCRGQCGSSLKEEPGGCLVGQK